MDSGVEGDPRGDREPRVVFGTISSSSSGVACISREQEPSPVRDWVQRPTRPPPLWDNGSLGDVVQEMGRDM